MTTNGRTHHSRWKHGFTLTEAMLAVTVLGLAAAGVLLPFVSGATVRAEGTRRTLAAELASDLIEKIIITPFEQIVDDYNYVELQGQVKDTTGVVFADPKYANFSRKVTCSYATAPPQTDPPQYNFILVTVQVDYSGKNVATVSRLVSQ
jgi:prepilin-type N-terminal cleavage/methylation domain-containing protein